MPTEADAGARSSPRRRRRRGRLRAGAAGGCSRTARFCAHAPMPEIGRPGSHTLRGTGCRAAGAGRSESTVRSRPRSLRLAHATPEGGPRALRPADRREHGDREPVRERPAPPATRMQVRIQDEELPGAPAIRGLPLHGAGGPIHRQRHADAERERSPKDRDAAAPRVRCRGRANASSGSVDARLRPGAARAASPAGLPAALSRDPTPRAGCPSRRHRRRRRR